MDHKKSNHKGFIDVHLIFCIYGSVNLTEEGKEKQQKPEYQEVCCETDFTRSGYINKSGKICSISEHVATFNL